MQEERFTNGVNADDVGKIERFVDEESAPFHAELEAIGAYVIAARMKAEEEKQKENIDQVITVLDERAV